MSEEKTYTFQVTLESAERRLLKQAQQRWHHAGFSRLSLEQLIKVYMLAGLAFSDDHLKKEVIR